jgi:hypothetical protein
MSDTGSGAGARGGVNPNILKEHEKTAKTVEQFLEHFRGQTIEDLRQANPLELRDPAFPKKLIDMGHFLSAADQQSVLATERGFALEIHHSATR